MKSLSRCTLHSFALGAACSAVVLAPALYLYLRRAASIQRFNVDARFTDVCAYDGLVFMSGQVASRGDSIEEQTEAVLADIDAALALAGSHKSRILECTIWLASMDDYAGMNSVYDKWVVPGDSLTLKYVYSARLCSRLCLGKPPCRACVQAILAAPRYKVEIRVIAAKL